MSILALLYHCHFSHIFLTLTVYISISLSHSYCLINLLQYSYLTPAMFWFGVFFLGFGIYTKTSSFVNMGTGCTSREKKIKIFKAITFCPAEYFLYVSLLSFPSPAFYVCLSLTSFKLLQITNSNDTLNRKRYR